MTVPDLETILYLNDSITTNSTIHQFQGWSLFTSQPRTWQINLEVSYIPSTVGNIDALAPSVGSEFVINLQTCKFFNVDFKLEMFWGFFETTSVYISCSHKKSAAPRNLEHGFALWRSTMKKWKIRMYMCTIKTKLVLCFPSFFTSELLFCKAAFSSSSTFLLFLHLPSVLQFPLQIFFSPFVRAWRRFKNLTFQAKKSAWTLPLRLFTTLQSPSPLVMIRFPLSIHSHLSTFLQT